MTANADANADSGNPEKRTPAKYIRPAVLVLILTLAVWLTYYFMGVPLNAAATTIVTGIISLIVSGVVYCWRKIASRRNRNRAPEPLSKAA